MRGTCTKVNIGLFRYTVITAKSLDRVLGVYVVWSSFVTVSKEFIKPLVATTTMNTVRAEYFTCILKVKRKQRDLNHKRLCRQGRDIYDRWPREAGTA